MKSIAFFILLLILQMVSYSQSDPIPATNRIRDSIKVPVPVKNRYKIKTDSVTISSSKIISNSYPSVISENDTIKKDLYDTLKSSPKINKQSFINSIFSVEQSGKPIVILNSERHFSGKELLFYMISSLFLFFGLFKVFYSRYFFNVFKVFFNTSLRQTQLTDILIQARLASMIFNLLFVFSTGIYIWEAYINNGIFNKSKLAVLPICIIGILTVYLIKYFIIVFIGWLTNYKEAANQYIFIIFLINKIVGVFLLPFIVLLSFGPSEWNHAIIIISSLLLVTLFLLRYFRTYGLLQKQLSLNIFHFFLYLIGIEILPIIAFYQLFTSFIKFYSNTLS